MGALLDRALAITDYRAKRARFDQVNPSLRVRKGIGLATFMHGAGFTGSGEDHLASVVAVEATADGRVRVLSSNTEIGQGTNTIFAQIAADALGVAIDAIEIAQPDTAIVPDSGPTVASRTCMVVGKLVETAARGLISELTKAGFVGGGGPEEFRRACAGYTSSLGPLRATARYQAAAGPALGRRDVSGRCLRHLCVGGVRGRGLGRHRDLGDARGRLRRGAGSGEGDQSRARRPGRSRAAWRRRSAGRSTSAWCGARGGWPTAR